MGRIAVEKSSCISPCGQYRYALTRQWEARKPGVLFILLNPSVADADRDDPTLRRCLGFARTWDCGSLTVVNLFAYRATDPARLLSCAASAPRLAVGLENDRWIQSCVAAHSERGARLVAGWGALGNHLALRWRRDEVLRLLAEAELHCLETTASGEPRHPLYCRADRMPVPFVHASLRSAVPSAGEIKEPPAR